MIGFVASTHAAKAFENCSSEFNWCSHRQLLIRIDSDQIGKFRRAVTTRQMAQVTPDDLRVLQTHVRAMTHKLTCGHSLARVECPLQFKPIWRPT